MLVLDRAVLVLEPVPETKLPDPSPPLAASATLAPGQIVVDEGEAETAEGAASKLTVAVAVEPLQPLAVGVTV